MEAINYKTIKIARESKGLTQKDLSIALNVHQGYLSKIEKGLIDISIDFINDLSSNLKIPRSFFYKETQKSPINSIYYRKRASLSQKKISILEANIERIRIAIDEMLDDLSITEYNLFSLEPIDNEITPEDIARKARVIMKVEPGPIENLILVIEKCGIIVCEIDGENEFSGKSILTDKGQPIILINKNMPNDRKRYTLAHELGHMIMHLDFPYSDKTEKEIEKEANIFASEFLVPIREIRQELLNLRYNHLDTLKMYWKVSKASIIYKAEYYNLITPSQTKSLRIYLTKTGQRKNETILVPLDQPTTLKDMVNLYNSDLGYSDMDVENLLGMDITDIETILKGGNSKIVYLKPRFVG